MDGTTYRWLTFDAPYLSPETLFEVQDAEAFFWDDGSEITVGLGVAAQAVSRGEARWSRIRRRADSIFRRLHVIDDIPRLFGGLGFRGGRQGEARFVLPRWTYRLAADGKARGGVALPAMLPAAHRARAIDGIRWRLETLSRRRIEAPSARPLRVEPPDADRWRSDVQAALTEIEEGRLVKVVAARPFDLTFEVSRGLASPAAVLRALSRDHDESGVRFAFRQGSRTFLGLTPERLVQVEGRQVRTEALAGTAPAGCDAAAELRNSSKDAHEHRLVVDEIATRLRPLCTRLLHDTSPRLRSSSGVQHLLTPIEGELMQPIHVLDVARRLHPTPAVCGLPSADAARWIYEHETLDRGWYSGAIGHFDAAGDGEFRVALRCAELDEYRARVWAGAGLVAGSDPDRELQEIGLKAATMLDAFARAADPAADHQADTPVHLPFTRLA